MKKLILLFALGFVAFSCSEETTELEQTETNAQVESVDPKTTPRAELDDSGLGMYHGFIATLDSQFNAKIWINAGNDGNFNATVKTVSGDKFSFFSHEADMAGTQFVFKGVNGAFAFDITNPDNAVVSDVVINGKEGISHVNKEFSTQRGVVSLGSYVDALDGAFTGVWNLVSDGTPHPAGAGVVVTENFVLSPSGNPFTDTTIETFDYPCFTQTGIPPLLLYDPGVNNEIWLQEQTSMFGSFMATYDIGISAIVRDGNNLGYDAFSNGDGTQCLIETDQGTWSWNGRAGTISFPSDVPLPVLGCTDPASVAADTGGTILGYRNDESVTRVVTTGDASPMSLYFTECDIEDGFDFLEIFDGADTSAPSLGVFTGSALFQQQIDGTGDSLTLLFTSDGSVTAAGYAAEVCGVAPPPLTCDEDYVDTGGITGDYSSSEDITTTYTAPGLGEVVLATFQVFNLEAGWDFMRVYDGPIEDPLTEVTDINGEMTSTGSGGGNGFTGTQLQGETFQSTGADLTFVFESDASFTAPGWEICIQYVTPLGGAPTVSPVKDLSKDTAPLIMVEAEPMTLNK